MAVRFLEIRPPLIVRLWSENLIVTEVQLNVHNTCGKISETGRPINAMHNWPPYEFALSTSLIIKKKRNLTQTLPSLRNFVLSFFILLAETTLFLKITDSSRPLYFFSDVSMMIQTTHVNALWYGCV
jgi:hypothetical protein